MSRYQQQLPADDDDESLKRKVDRLENKVDELRDLIKRMLEERERDGDEN